MITITERVVKSDRRRERAMVEQQFLLKAHESSPSAIPKAIFSVRLSRAKDELEDPRKITLTRAKWDLRIGSAKTVFESRSGSIRIRREARKF
jgi:hypothetical protein